MNLREYIQPDKLLDTLKIILTPEQKIYLRKEYPNHIGQRTLLMKKFNLKYGTKHSKLQFTRAIEKMKIRIPKPKVEKDPNRIKNVYYIREIGKWECKITLKKVRHRLYVGTKEGAIQAIAEFRKENGLK